MTGRISKLMPDRSFGFIAGPGGIDYFFHASGCAADVNFDGLSAGSILLVIFEANRPGKGILGPRSDVSADN